MINTPELLAPAGDLMKLKYAFAYGADAVYAGIPRFSLRARENDFNDESISEAVRLSHQLNKKIYLTINIFPHNRKIESLENTLRWMQELKPDAIIVSDPGILMLSQKYCPSVPVHLSTQANTVNWAAVKFWHQQGVQRIILSRELSIDEISQIRQRVPEIELEAFVHGAICVAYSGRCLLSNYFTHRDPNQGTCTNSCRWEYKLYEENKSNPELNYQVLEGNYFLEENDRPGELLPVDEDENGTYIMNSRDLCAIQLLEKMRYAGINSFKIEGRSKSVYYVSVITRAYRKALDDVIAGEPFDENLLKEVYAVANRGYITGFLEKNPRQLGENIHNSHSGNQTHQFCAIVKSVSKSSGRATISVRNRFEVGDEIEAIEPYKTQRFQIKNIFTLTGENITVAHGGGTDVAIDIPVNCTDVALLRKVVRNNPPKEKEGVNKHLK